MAIDFVQWFSYKEQEERLTDFLITLLFAMTIFSIITGWIVIIADYLISGEYTYRRSLRQKLKNSSLSQMERDYIDLILSINPILYG